MTMDFLDLDKLKKRITKLKIRKSLYVDYLKDRVDAEDWHGVQDAGSDLREVEEQISLLQEIKEWADQKTVQNQKDSEALLRS